MVIFTNHARIKNLETWRPAKAAIDKCIADIKPHEQYPQAVIGLITSGFKGDMHEESTQGIGLRLDVSALDEAQKQALPQRFAQLTGLNVESVSGDGIVTLRSPTSITHYPRGGTPKELEAATARNEAALAEYPGIAKNFTDNADAIKGVLEEITAADVAAHNKAWAARSTGGDSGRTNTERL